VQVNQPMIPLYGRTDGGDCQSSPSPDEIRLQLDVFLANSSECVDWNVVNGLLQCLPIDHASRAPKYASTQDDPMGRLLMAGILSRNPPLAIVDTAIHIFPCSLNKNPSAFLIAYQHASTEVFTRMIRSISKEDQCPFPWILSEQVSVEIAKIALEAFPEGVWKPSPFLSNHNLLDYLLVSPEVVNCRTFDSTMWAKVKLVLVAAGAFDKELCPPCGCKIAPVQVILKRVLSRAGMYAECWTCVLRTFGPL